MAYLLWPPLVYIGDHGNAKVNPDKSMYSSIAYSNGDKTVTVKLKPWSWSDGKPITSWDFMFMYNLAKFNKTAWSQYAPGLIPDNVTSFTAPDASTVVLQLKQAYNPTFFTDNQLGLLAPIPQHAWDKTSSSSP
ncbi:MAG: ABC transporter substrate-binding protein, partial [Acidimicrobiales bacterium]